MTEQSNQQDPNVTKQTAEPTAQPAPQAQPTATALDKTGGKTYSEAEVETLIKERLEREKKARERAANDAREKAEQEAAAKNQEYEKLAKINEEKAAKLEAELKSLKLSELRRAVAEKVGIPAALASRLIGETAEALEADAKALLETLPKPTPAPEKPKAQPGIIPANPGANGQQGETKAQKDARIHGSPVNPFDPYLTSQHGGGAQVHMKGDAGRE